MDRHTAEQRSKNMRAVKNKDSKIEVALRLALYHKGYRYRKNYDKVYGHPDIVFTKQKVAIFCDSEFWHGYDWDSAKNNIKSHRDFWIPKIEHNMERDREVNEKLAEEGYTVLRFWGKQIKKDLNGVVAEVETTLNRN
jgi:DNA mismatch endonuclease Vsr